jgi:predicted O-linked N-acetylglucosamine transferase (SPINDLY family)
MPEPPSTQQSDAGLQILGRAVGLHQKGMLAEAERLYRQVLNTQPDQFDALHLLGVIKLQQQKDSEAVDLISAALRARPDVVEALCHLGAALANLNRPGEALHNYDKALAIRPADPVTLFNRGIALACLNRYAEAVPSYQRALTFDPNNALAHYNLGTALRLLRRYPEALASFDKALAIKPDFAEALNNRGIALKELQRPQEALTSYDQALAIAPNSAEALYNRGNALLELKRPEDALLSYDRALALKPGSAEVLDHRGNALKELERYDEALASYEKAIAIKPNNASVYYNLGTTLQTLHRHREALANFDKAVAIKPDFAEALNNRGVALKELRREEEALASFERALGANAGYAEALCNRGNALKILGRDEEALASYNGALAIRPDFADAFYNRGNALKQMKRYDEALRSFDQAVAINPNHPDAHGGAEAVLALCDWDRAAKVAAELAVEVEAGKPSVTPFTLLGYLDDPALQLQCAKTYLKENIPVRPDALWNGAIYRHDKIRIAYLSADFHEHATAYLLADLLEGHDRSRFEVVGISFDRDDGSEMRRRLVKSFDQFHDVRVKDDREAAKLLNDMEIDIAIDLKGHTQDARPEILSFRPAPVQVNFLGYPGTMGADFIDYIIADPVVAPLEQQAFYTEKILHLPDCYQPNSQRRIADRAPSRQEARLPDQGFVFCCFNNNYKITSPVFGVWMRLLQNVPGSVLWLLRDNPGAERNLRREAEARAIGGDRLIFADRLPHDEHMARHRLADLFLDTLPVTAHTTASDALWAGLPLLTCCGKSFVARVAASTLHAANLPELVTHSLQDYEALALKLASDPALLHSVRQKLEKNRLSSPLFDTQRYRRHIEAAYTGMWKISRRGESPRSFTVAAI